MTDTERRLDDIEKRLARLERGMERPAVTYADIAKTYRQSSVSQYTLDGGKQFCKCGRDICRAPDCPSHKADPLGR